MNVLEIVHKNANPGKLVS